MKKAVVVIPVDGITDVGPEIVVKAMGHPEVYEWYRLIVVRKLSAMERAVSATESRVKIRCVEHPDEADAEFGILDLIDLKSVDANKIEFGKVQRDAGWTAFEFIEKPMELLKSGKADAIATATTNRGALKAADIHYIGHTEIIGGLLGVEDPMTMSQAQSLRMFFLSGRLSLQQVIELVTEEHVYRYIRRVHQGMQNLNIEDPRLAIAGLNPHSGGHGLFGQEEVKGVAPAIGRVRAEGINTEGPIGADSVSCLTLKGNFDATISLYHDQEHIATKMVDFERTISVTVGMPYIRTSMGHGTAFDIAGKNLAGEVSMCGAIRLAAKYSITYKPRIC